jgi:predicted transcriptional regulator
MVPLPHSRPRQLSLGPLEREILEIIWELGVVTVKDIHDRILSDPDRELAYASVATILNRLTQKKWLTCNKQERTYEHLNQFLAVGNPDIVAAFADDLDRSSLEQLEAIAQRLQAIRTAKEKQ